MRADDGDGPAMRVAGLMRLPSLRSQRAAVRLLAGALAGVSGGLTRAFLHRADEARTTRERSIQGRGYQREPLDATDAAVTRGLRRLLVVLPTGTGKTIIFAHLLRQLGGRALVHRGRP